MSHPVLTLATLNISYGRAAGLWSAARAMQLGEVNIAVVQESKFTNADFATKNADGYSILTAETDKKNSGGVSLLWREGDQYKLENGKMRGPNTVTCEVQTGEA